LEGKYWILAILACGNIAVLISSMFFSIYVPELRNLWMIASVLATVDTSFLAIIKTYENMELKNIVRFLKWLLG